MFIDKKSGAIELPNGFVITAGLDKAGFEDSVCFRQATPYDYGTLPFQWYRFDGGQLDGHVFNVNLCFYSDMLVDFSVGANFYQSNPRKWEHFSLDIESQSKVFHDQLLQDVLGNPHKRTSLPSGENQLGLKYRIEYSYKWGTVWSVYDGHAGSSYIGIRYGSRLKDAQDDYRRMKKA